VQGSCVYLYPTVAVYGGSLGGRVGADELCAAAKPSGLACTSVRAFLSVSASDSISQMPANYGAPGTATIRRPDGTLIDSSWSGMLDGDILASVSDPMPSDYWWSGSDDSGDLDPWGACAAWTDGSQGFAAGGLVTATRGWMLQEGYSCSAPWHLVCACW
jgi:hypothetical protein